ncbi:unnamed protein product [Prorocentrum cordatum]|uniref:Uncharacterized protein n=1 Tax=Prorocentrum cordatum TaxID=2364126 RepID=A0ABN9QAS5_9DINO|nr:unnamed protein product [Polarella glacialis]
MPGASAEGGVLAPSRLVLCDLPSGALHQALSFLDGVGLGRWETTCAPLGGLVAEDLWRGIVLRCWGWLLRQKPPSSSWKALCVRLHTGASSCFCVVGAGPRAGASCAHGLWPPAGAAGPGARGRWVRLPAPAETREMAGVVRSAAGSVVVVGGTSPRVDERGRLGFRTLASAESCTDGVWSPLAAMREPRCCCSAALDARGGVFVVGGGTSMYRGAACFRTVEYLPSLDGVWQEAPAMVSMRCAVGVAISHETSRLFAFGGYSGVTYLETCEALELHGSASARWTLLPPMTCKRAGCNAACGPDGRVLDVRTSAWQLSRSRLRWGRHYNAAAFGPDGLLYVSGAFRHTGQLDVVERYDPRIDRWEELSPIGTVVNFSAGTFVF